MRSNEIEKNFETFAKKVEDFGKQIEKFVPYAIVKETSTFGNSSHVVLSRSFLNKKVGVIILGDSEEK